MLKKAFAFLALLISFAACTPPQLAESGPERFTITRSEFTIEWADIEIANLTMDLNRLEYIIYARELSSSTWKELGKIPYSEYPHFTVNRDVLVAPGKYVFAIAAEYEGNTSGRHSSLDPNADPVSGWYVNWVYSD